MKLTNKILLIAFGMGLIFTTFIMIKLGSFVQIKKLEPSGIIDNKLVDVDEFDEIWIGKGVNVFLSQTENESLIIKVDTSFQKHIKLEVVNRKLSIHSEVNLPDSLRLIAYINVKTLDVIEVSGRANLHSSNIFQGDSLIIIAKNGGKLTMDIDLKYLDCEVRSGSKMNLTGNAQYVNAIAKEGAKLNAAKLKAIDVKAEAKSGAQMYFSISGSLDVKAQSGGVVEYQGSPTVEGMDVASGGKVSKVTEQNN